VVFRRFAFAGVARSDPARALLYLQGLRVWVLATLGPRWDHAHHRRSRRTAGRTRALPLPVASNYCVVVGEILILPLAFGLVWYGVVFSILNLAILSVRIRAENKALSR